MKRSRRQRSKRGRPVSYGGERRAREYITLLLETAKTSNPRMPIYLTVSPVNRFRYGTVGRHNPDSARAYPRISRSGIGRLSLRMYRPAHRESARTGLCLTIPGTSSSRSRAKHSLRVGLIALLGDNEIRCGR